MDLSKPFTDARQVLTSPSSFFQSMPRSGSLPEPLIFIVAMAVVTGLLAAIASLFSGSTGFFASFFDVSLATLWCIALWVLIGGSLLFFLWRRLGSTCGYETSLRVCAYASVIAPVYFLLHNIFGWGWMGLGLSLAGLAYLLIRAGEQSHGIPGDRLLLPISGLATLLFVFQLLGSGDEKHVVEHTVVSASEPAKTEAVELLSSSSDAESERSTTKQSLANQQVEIPETVDASPGISSSELTQLIKPESDTGSDALALDSGASKVGESLGQVVQQVEQVAVDLGEELETVGEDLKRGWDKVFDATADSDVSSDELDATAASQVQVQPGIAEQTGQAVGKMVDQLGVIASDLGDGFKKGLEKQPVDTSEPADSSEHQADVAEAESGQAVDLEEQSVVALASEKLGAVIDGLGDAAAEVGRNLQQAIVDDSDDDKVDSEVEDEAMDGKSPGADSDNQLAFEQGSVESQGERLPAISAPASAWTPELLGEAMAEFVLELDTAAEADDAASAESAAESLEQFLEAYRQSLKQRR